MKQKISAFGASSSTTKKAEILMIEDFSFFVLTEI